MDAMLIRQFIQLRLCDGRLPQDRSVEGWSWSGSGTCDACGVAIMASQRMTIRIDAEDRELRFHDQCFEIWNDERLKGRAGQA